MKMKRSIHIFIFFKLYILIYEFDVQNVEIEAKNIQDIKPLKSKYKSSRFIEVFVSLCYVHTVILRS